MGTWGYGILQNDSAQDGIGDLARTIEDDVAGLADRPATVEAAARAGAAVGLLLQFSEYSLNPESEASAGIRRGLKAQEPAFDALPGKAGSILRGVLEGTHPGLEDRLADLDERVVEALIGPAEEEREFPTQRAFGRREPDLFAHPEAARYAQEVAERCAGLVDEDFEDDEIVDDLCRESTAIGPLGLLLLIEPCRLDPDRVEAWRERAAEGFATMEEDLADEDPDGELEFYAVYRACLDKALAVAAEKAAAG